MSFHNKQRELEIEHITRVLKDGGTITQHFKNHDFMILEPRDSVPPRPTCVNFATVYYLREQGKIVVDRTEEDRVIFKGTPPKKTRLRSIRTREYPFVTVQVTSAIGHTNWRFEVDEVGMVVKDLNTEEQFFVMVSEDWSSVTIESVPSS